jgi:hypothetical protein
MAVKSSTFGRKRPPILSVAKKPNRESTVNKNAQDKKGMRFINPIVRGRGK